LKQPKTGHAPRMRGIQYAEAAVVAGSVGVYWIIRFRG
jgi:hypothetical protein